MAMAHSKLGASGAHRWMVCPASINLSEGMPNESSVYARHGSAAHALCEFLLVNRHENAEDYQGYYINAEGDFYKPGDGAKDSDINAFEIDQDMIDSVNIYTAAIFEEYDEFCLIERTHLFVEESFDLSFIRANMFGTNDASVFVPKRFMTVSDFKYGRGKVVEAEENVQGMYYALGAIRKLCYNKKTKQYDPELLPKDVTIQIIQPRAWHVDRPVRSWTVPVERIIVDFAKVLKDAAEATSIPNAQLRAGDHCYFCPAKPKCPEIRSQAEEALQVSFDDLDDYDETELSDLGKEKARAISSDAQAVGEAMKALPLMDAFAKALEGYALNLAKSGETIPGQKLVTKGTKRRWTNPEAARKALSKVLKADEYLGPRPLLTFTKIEKLDGMAEVVNGPKGKPEEGLVHKPEGGLTLAPMSDKRKEVELDPGSDFEDYDEDAN